MNGVVVKKTRLIGYKDINHYYEYLLEAFKKEFLGSSNRHLIEDMSCKSVYSESDSKFLENIVQNGFCQKNPYKKSQFVCHKFEHPIELLNYVVQEGYTPSSPFVYWAHKKLSVHWTAAHWFLLIMRNIASVDLISIRKELRMYPKRKELPQSLEFYYRLGTGLERVQVHPDIGIRKILQSEFRGKKHYRNFDPIDYLDYYYGGLDKEDMTIARVFYEMLLKHRENLPRHSTALIVGNGPTPDEAQALAMIPEIKTIIPADVDERNINIMKMHTGKRNPLATQKARPGEEHADFIYYLFEKHTQARFGLFAVREIAAVKAKDPVYIDVSKKHPLSLPRNKEWVKKLKSDIVVVPFCPESITNSYDNYRSYLKNISTLVPQNRYLCMLALKDANFYVSGVKKMKAFPVNEKIISEELQKNGFTDIEITVIETGFKKSKRGFSDSMVIWARKI